MHICTHIFTHIIVFSVGMEPKVLCAREVLYSKLKQGLYQPKAAVTELLSGLSRAVAHVNSQQVWHCAKDQCKLKPDKIQAWGGEAGTKPLREEESIFFKGVTPGRSAMLLWMAKHLRIWTTKIGLSEIRKTKSPPKVQRLGNRGRSERSWGREVNIIV